MRRIFSQVRRNGCRTLVIEDIAGADELTWENEELQKHPEVGTLSKSVSFRLSFFDVQFTGPVPPEVTSSNFKGYAIVRGVQSASGWKCSWVYESVVLPERITNNFIPKAPKWECCITGEDLTIQGHLYAQQNGKTNCCAHVAVRSAAATFSGTGDLLYHEMNKIIGGYTGGGLKNQQMVKILESVGATCFVGNFDVTQSSDPDFFIPFQKYIYGSIESGYPAIIFFGVRDHGDYHAIPVLGHTFNQDNWVPRAERGYFKIGKKIRYIPSESWLSMFISHDDNFGSNYCIPRHYLHTGSESACKECKKGNSPDTHQACVCHVIGTMPNFIKINPIEAEAIGADYLFELKDNLPTESDWHKRLKFYAEESRLVLRPILVTADEYILHLESVTGWKGDKISAALLTTFRDNLSNDWYWLVELSVSELFAANKRKVGEVLIRATIDHNSKRSFDSFGLARLPGYFALYNEEKGSFAFVPSGIDDHVELFGQESPVVGALGSNQVNNL